MGQGRRPTPSTQPPDPGELAAVPAALRNARPRGVVGGDRGGGVGEAVEAARREGPDRLQPRPLGCVPALLSRVRAARHRHRLRAVRRAARDARHVRRRRPPLLRLEGQPAEHRRHRLLEGLARGLFGASQGAPAQRAGGARLRPHLDRREGGADAGRLGERPPAATELGDDHPPATSATRSAPSRSPAARSGSGSSRRRAAGRTRNYAPSSRRSSCNQDERSSPKRRSSSAIVASGSRWRIAVIPTASAPATFSRRSSTNTQDSAGTPIRSAPSR